MLQEIKIVGHLGRDPEMRYTPTGKPVTSFPVAVKDKVYTDGELQEATIWFRVVTWGNSAEACQKYLSKGDLVLVNGKLLFDPETGGPKIWGEDEAKTNFEINAELVKFLVTKGGKKSSDSPFDEEEEEDTHRKARRVVGKSGKSGKSEKKPWE